MRETRRTDRQRDRTKAWCAFPRNSCHVAGKHVKPKGEGVGSEPDDHLAECLTPFKPLESLEKIRQLKH